MDERAGHRCRYSTLLDLELRRNGWRYDGHVFQCLLFPLVYLSRRLAGGASGRAPARAASIARSDSSTGSR